MRRPNSRKGGHSKRGAGGADSEPLDMFPTREEMPGLLARGLAAIAAKFKRRGHVFDAMLFCWQLEVTAGRDGFSAVRQEVLNRRLDWGGNQRKIKEVRDALQLAGWVDVLDRCPTCDGTAYTGIRLNWPSITIAAARGDIDHQMVDAITNWWEQSPFGGSDHHAQYKDSENSEFENLNKPQTQNSPGRADRAKPPREWTFPPHLRGRTNRHEDSQRLLRDPDFVRQLWQNAKARLRDLIDERDSPIDFKGFAVAAHYSARPGDEVEHAARLFVDQVCRRTWRLPAGETGHIPQKAFDEAKPFLVELGLERAERPKPYVDREAEAARERARQTRELVEQRLGDFGRLP